MMTLHHFVKRRGKDSIQKNPMERKDEKDLNALTTWVIYPLVPPDAKKKKKKRTVKEKKGPQMFASLAHIPQNFAEKEERGGSRCEKTCSHQSHVVRGVEGVERAGNLSSRAKGDPRKEGKRVHFPARPGNKQQGRRDGRISCSSQRGVGTVDTMCQRRGNKNDLVFGGGRRERSATSLGRGEEGLLNSR